MFALPLCLRIQSHLDIGNILAPVYSGIEQLYPFHAQFRPQLIFLRIKESLELSRDFESVLSSAKG